MNTGAFAQVQGRSDNGRGSAPVHLINEERAKPANCYSINNCGGIEEGIHLELNHPLTGDKPAIVLGGERYVARDTFGFRGCLYEVADGRALVRRASIGMLELPSGKTFPLLRKAEADQPAAIIVRTDFGMAMSGRPRNGFEPLWAGVDGSATRVASGGTEALVEVRKGEELLVFYPLGIVMRVEYANFAAGQKMGVILDADLSLNARLDLMRTLLAKASRRSEGREHAEDAALHEYARMLKASRSPSQRMKILDTMAAIYANGQEFRSGVRQHFKTVLKALGDHTIYGWLADESAVEVSAASTVNARSYDGRLHGLISDAMDYKGAAWWEVAFNAIKAAADEGQLRPGVKKRFCTQCPPELSELSDEVGRLPVTVSEQNHAPSPLGTGNKNKLSRKEQDARRKHNRDERHKLQPQKGSSGGGGKKGSGDKSKKNGKK